MQPVEMTITDYFEVLKRRKWSLILPATLIFIAATVVALVLEPVYKSTATILIEQQEMPADFVMTTITSYAEQRMQAINQQVMSSARLQEMIKHFDLYREELAKKTTEEVLEQMRKDIKLTPVSVDTVDRRTGRPSTATIAFTLSFEAKEAPNKVQEVTNNLASIFLKQNLETRERQTKETSEFLQVELKKRQEALAELENQIAAFKKKHLNDLPELLQINMQSLTALESNRDRLTDQLRNYQEQNSNLTQQLAIMEPYLKNPNRPEKQDFEQQRLDALKSQVIQLQSRYSEEYPDVVKGKTDIAELEKELANRPKTASEIPELPNPAYATLSAQLAGSKSEITSLKQQIQDVNQRIVEYERRIMATPQVENEYKTLLAEQSNTQLKYNDLAKKVMEADLAQGLEKEQKGERFTLIDPPMLPEKPDKPNRLAIILLGFLLGVGAGVSLAALREFSDYSVRSASALAQLTALPVLATIPELITAKERRGRQRKKIAISLAVLVALALAILAFHLLVMDLDVLITKIMRRLLP